MPRECENGAGEGEDEDAVREAAEHKARARRAGLVKLAAGACFHQPLSNCMSVLYVPDSLRPTSGSQGATGSVVSAAWTPPKRP